MFSSGAPMEDINVNKIIIIIIIHRIYIALYIKIDLKALNDTKNTRKNTAYYST